ncbi:MAG: hypothetical protein ABIH41_00790 [Nanoarchaeota archaeon]
MRLTNILALVAILAVAACQTGDDSTPSPKTYPGLSELDWKTIPEINANSTAGDEYNTAGRVVKIYTCPPCPKGMLCSTCMRDNIVISMYPTLLEDYDLTEDELIIFAERPDQFVLGKTYHFSLRVTDVRTTGAGPNDVELIGYTEWNLPSD